MSEIPLANLKQSFDTDWASADKKWKYKLYE